MTTGKLGWKERALLVLIVVTVAMWARDRMPASPQAVIELRALASKNEISRQALDHVLASGDDLSVGDVRQLRNQVVAIQAATQRLSTDATARAMATEWKRLEAMSLSEMSWDDRLRWLLLSAKPYASWLLGGLAGVAALLLMRRAQRSKAKTS